MSETVNLKLANVQYELKAPKGQYNKFGKYKYRSCEDILEAVKPVLAKHGAYLIISDEIELIGDRFYVKATAKFIDSETGTMVSCSAYAREEENKKGMDSSQLTGSTSSYARKYALNGLLCIDDNRDSDSTNTHGNGNDQSNGNDNNSSNNASSNNDSKEVKEFIKKLKTAPNLEQLKEVWLSIPSNLKSLSSLTNAKDEMKTFLEEMK